MLNYFHLITQYVRYYEKKKSILSNHELKLDTIKLKNKVNFLGFTNKIIAEAFSIVIETSKRVLGEKHYNVQILSGFVLHNGMIAEMRTGEGKTLSSSLSIYLNALKGKGVHVVTVNDYLSKRDAFWMGKIYTFHNLSVGYLISGINEKQRRNIYKCDIVYGTNNEFAFDYLKNNLKIISIYFSKKSFFYAIIDEIDNILIDESTTPLIICDTSLESLTIYSKINSIILLLDINDYKVDLFEQNVSLTDIGVQKCEILAKNFKLISSYSNIYDIENISIFHYINQSIKAHKLLKLNIDYIIQNGLIFIIDSLTGRIVKGRKYSNGLHQAIEAKEYVKINSENQILASITFQNYFKIYPKLSGMTGTASTDVREFIDIYSLKVFCIPTNFDSKRTDFNDVIYSLESIKNLAITLEIKKYYNLQQPILIGSINIKKSELISNFLTINKIKHFVLNAKFHIQESLIISQAGQLNSVTIATNIAGRGTDIKLGGNINLYLKHNFYNNQTNNFILFLIKNFINLNRNKVFIKGGLVVVGTERNEIRRIDNQLIGRTGRQGDKGRSRFFISLEDKLIQFFGNIKIDIFLKNLGFKDYNPILHPWINKALKGAQIKIEDKNFEIRKNLLKFDTTVDSQRKIFYLERYKIIHTPVLKSIILDKILLFNKIFVDKFIHNNSYNSSWEIINLVYSIIILYNHYFSLCKFNTKLKILNKINFESLLIFDAIIINLSNKKKLKAIKKIFIIFLDQLWKEHLLRIEKLKLGISLRIYIQKDPFHEFRIETFNIFRKMLYNLYKTIIITFLNF